MGSSSAPTWAGWGRPSSRHAKRCASARRSQLGLPDGTRFTFEGAIATPLGPRSEEWLSSAVADPNVAVDITPWWADAPDPRYLLNRALALMWTDVRWRRPAIDGEQGVLEDVHRHLARAYPIEPDLPYPWSRLGRGHRLRRDRGRHGPSGDLALDRRRRRPQVPIGYRRSAVRITHEGWSLWVPGDFAERRTSDEWWGGGPGRRITLAAVPTGSMSAQAFVSQFAGDLGSDALSHVAGDLVGRARITTDPSSGLEIAVLDGYSAVPGSGAAIRIEFDDAGDWQWATDLWRSLAPG